MNPNYITEYLRITIIGLEQDLEGLAEEMEALDPASKDFANLDIEYNFINGQRAGMAHILDVIQKG